MSKTLNSISTADLQYYGTEYLPLVSREGGILLQTRPTLRRSRHKPHSAWDERHLQLRPRSAGPLQHSVLQDAIHDQITHAILRVHYLAHSELASCD